MDIRLDRITIDPEVMNGQPCLRNLRLTVRRVVEAVALYPDWKDLQTEYPELETAARILRETGWDVIHTGDIGLSRATDKNM